MVFTLRVLLVVLVQRVRLEILGKRESLATLETQVKTAEMVPMAREEYRERSELP